MSESVLEARDLTKHYGSAAVVAALSFDVRRGEIFTLLGPSGCGKSTTLRMVAGLERPDSGELHIHGRAVAAPARNLFVGADRRNLGLVFQSYAIWPHMTVGENVGYPLRLRRVAPDALRRKVDEVLELVGLGPLRDRAATSLSGGQQQRVALARALVYEPDLLLLDEPLSNLDAQLRDELRLQLKLLQSRIGTTILYVTHDQTEAMSLSHRVAVMRDGRIEQVGSPRDIYERPESYFVQSFVGRVISLPGTVCTEGGASWFSIAQGNRIALPGQPAPGPARATLRPEDISLLPGPGAGLRGRIDEVIYCGDHLQCVIGVAGTSFTLVTPKTSDARLGATIGLGIDPDKVRLWPA